MPNVYRGKNPFIDWDKKNIQKKYEPPLKSFNLANAENGSSSVSASDDYIPFSLFLHITMAPPTHHDRR